ncbi:hypothetical protein KC320_g134 [Hortaea werneckii]|nr:hypothetical protein KC320_g134 [Hortaea werneckii]
MPSPDPSLLSTPKLPLPNPQSSPRAQKLKKEPDRSARKAWGELSAGARWEGGRNELVDVDANFTLYDEMPREGDEKHKDWDPKGDRVTSLWMNQTRIRISMRQISIRGRILVPLLISKFDSRAPSLAIEVFDSWLSATGAQELGGECLLFAFRAQGMPTTGCK